MSPSVRRPAMLALEDGRVFKGDGFGAEAETTGEVVFNTAMTGYQEVMSDPSYCGQILTFTYPLIGNYGVNADDMESADLRAQGMVCRDLCEIPSNWRASGTLDAMLASRGVPGLSGIDTRALTRHLRDQGTMRSCLSTRSTNADELVEKARKSPKMEGLALADVVT
jgi:carbamoyl-phosphate synthase small subunit